MCNGVHSFFTKGLLFRQKLLTNRVSYSLDRTIPRRFASLVSPNSPKTRNRLLAALPKEESEPFFANMETIELDYKRKLYNSNQPIQYVYFPNNGVVSLTTTVEDGTTVEVATVGNEGMVSLPVFLGTDQIPGQAFVQIPGNTFRMTTEVFKEKVTPDTTLYALLQRYTQALFNQISQSAACNSLHSIEQRCCRWLLMSHDRMDSDQFLLTQEFLAQMLGVRRASVNNVATSLRNMGLIDYNRGYITVRDRAGLESTACKCYAHIRGEYERLLGGF
ncbi:MAG: Crp/Fnr family transcriptional regulator [Cyanobacteria bacterium QH_3_48_40]|nr:MAG: Crp/Fnr family transcriptional regulator [Cyanobacteria bacterium QH_3_48_40]